MKLSLRIASLLLAGAIGAGGSLLLTHSAPARAGSSDDTVTVFVDATFGFRKKHMASQLTKSHAKYAAMGYRYVDMAAYDENGDLVGFFVTYTRQ
ncbi:MAG TPA: hypothetical protein VFJ04_06145 [Rhodanobacteraceae bacterium]|jgi:hypothetical protein|nr:hypothetical protein [Rhodanobacteraceae bacterium]